MESRVFYTTTEPRTYVILKGNDTLLIGTSAAPELQEIVDMKRYRDGGTRVFETSTGYVFTLGVLTGRGRSEPDSLRFPSAEKAVALQEMELVD